MNGSTPAQDGGGSWGGAPGGAAGGRPTLDQILFMGLGSSPQRMTVSTVSCHAIIESPLVLAMVQSWTAMGADAVSLIVGTILMDTARYYDYFGDTDKRWVRTGVALGSFASLYVTSTFSSISCRVELIRTVASLSSRVSR